MISSEKVFDMLPMVTEIYDKLDLDACRKKLAEENKIKQLSNKDLGIEVFKYICKHSATIKEEVFEIVSIFESLTIEEVKAQNFMTTIDTLKQIITDKDATDFLKRAIQ